jgi:hypothetical protein
LKSKALALIVPALVLILCVPASLAHAYTVYQQQNTTVSLFAVEDMKANSTGFGLSMAQQNGLSDLSYVNVKDYQLFQATKFAQTTVVGIPVYIGFSLGYCENTPGSGVAQGLMTGLQVMMSKSLGSSGLSLNVRASTMAADINPTKWFSGEDILWAGAGLSYTF